MYPDKVKFIRLKKALKIAKSSFELEKGVLDDPVKTAISPEKAEENKERSIRRTQDIISDLIDCNDFELFPTFTFNPAKIDVTNDEIVKKKLTEWLNNANKKQKRLYGDNFDYVIVPERHKSGVLHFHGVLHNYRLEIYDTGFKDRSKRKIYKLRDYDRIGFSNTTKISDKAKTANYIRKHITKELNETEFGKKRYWASRGLKLPQKVYDLDLDKVIVQENLSKKPETVTFFENEWCEIWSFQRKNQ